MKLHWSMQITLITNTKWILPFKQTHRAFEICIKRLNRTQIYKCDIYMLQVLPCQNRQPIFNMSNIIKTRNIYKNIIQWYFPSDAHYTAGGPPRYHSKKGEWMHSIYVLCITRSLHLYIYLIFIAQMKFLSINVIFIVNTV